MSSKPEEPNESDCCGSGCNPCIFDVYRDELKKWESQQYNSQVSTALNKTKFSPFLVDKIEVISPWIKAFRFQSIALAGEPGKGGNFIQSSSDHVYEILKSNLNLCAGHYLILKGEYKSCNENGKVNNISRSYTPVLSESDFRNGIFEVVVAIYPNGKMSQFLDKLKVKDIVFWRGPYTEFLYQTNSYKKMLLFGGGTGIVPLYNIAKEIVENDSEETFVKLVGSFKSMQSIILRNKLNQLQDYWNFKMDIYITDQKDDDYNIKYNENIIFSKVNKNVIQDELSKHELSGCFIVICGPEPYNKFMSDTLQQLGVANENIFVFK